MGFFLELKDEVTHSHQSVFLGAGYKCRAVFACGDLARNFLDDADIAVF
jgi:hypothetical protein